MSEWRCIDCSAIIDPAEHYQRRGDSRRWHDRQVGVNSTRRCGPIVEVSDKAETVPAEILVCRECGMEVSEDRARIAFVLFGKKTRIHPVVLGGWPMEDVFAHLDAATTSIPIAHPAFNSTGGRWCGPVVPKPPEWDSLLAREQAEALLRSSAELAYGRERGELLFPALVAELKRRHAMESHDLDEVLGAIYMELGGNKGLIRDDDQRHARRAWRMAGHRTALPPPEEEPVIPEKPTEADFIEVCSRRADNGGGITGRHRLVHWAFRVLAVERRPLRAMCGQQFGPGNWREAPPEIITYCNSCVGVVGEEYDVSIGPRCMPDPHPGYEYTVFGPMVRAGGAEIHVKRDARKNTLCGMRTSASEWRIPLVREGERLRQCDRCHQRFHSRDAVGPS